MTFLSRRVRARAVFVPALLCAAALAPAMLPAQSRSELERVTRRKVLANGLEIVTVENHGVPLATVEIDVRNGAFTQPPSSAGLAHMYEHMFFQANAVYPEPEQFDARLGELGAVYNGTTREEVVNYFATVQSDSLRGAMEALSAAITAPLFRPDQLEREREVVLGEYDEKESSPFFRFTVETGKLLWPNSWSRKDPLGERSVLKAVTPAQMKAIQQKYYVPNNAALIVTGDVQPDSVFAWAEKYYSAWRRGPDPFVSDPIPAIPPVAHDTAAIIEAPVGSVTVFLQWQGPSVGADPAATYAADVFSDALNAPTSAFQHRLVDSGLWQGVVVNYYTLNRIGPITISGQTSPERLRDALAALDAEIAKVVEPGYFTADALLEVKAHRAVDSAFGAERASGLAHTIGFWWSVASVDYFLGYVDNMARQTPADLQRYARQYIIGKPRVVGIIVAPNDRQRIGLTVRELSRRAM